MSAPQNTTIERLIRKDGCVTYNPFFSHISQADAGSPNYGINWGQHRYNGAELLRCPGWYAFGHFPQLDIEQPSPAEDALNPFLSWASNDTRQGSGVIVRARGPNLSGDAAVHPAGLCQRLRRGAMLIGKRIRVTGAYNIIEADTGGSPIAVGMSVWLKGDPLSMTAPVSVPAPFAADNNGTVVAGGSTLSRAAGSFLADGVAAGDFLLVSGQTSLGANDSPIYQIKTVAAGSLTINGTFSDSVAGTAVWRIGRQSDGTASYVGRQAIRLGTSNDVGHVIRMSDDTYTAYDAGDEWLNRAFDTTVIPHVDPGETPKGPALYFKRYDPALGTVDYQGLNGHPRGARIWYLDNTFDNVPANGNQELVTSTAASGVQYFETEVEVDSSFYAPENDVWLCVFPCAPADAASIDTKIAVQMLALRVEVIPSAADSVEDNLKRAFTSGGLGGHADFALGDYDLRHCLQYPVYVPHLYPLKTIPIFPRLSTDVGGAETSLINYHYGGGSGPIGTFTQAQTEVFSSIVENLYAPQSDLPVGACAVEAALWVHYTTGLTSPVTASLQQYHHKYVGTPANFAQLSTYGVVTISSGVASPTLHTFSVYRNRVGHYWPQFSGTADPDSYAAHGTSQQMLAFSSSSVTGVASLCISNGWLLVAVDPRLHQNAYWSRV